MLLSFLVMPRAFVCLYENCPRQKLPLDTQAALNAHKEQCYRRLCREQQHRVQQQRQNVSQTNPQTATDPPPAVQLGTGAELDQYWGPDGDWEHYHGPEAFNEPDAPADAGGGAGAALAHEAERETDVDSDDEDAADTFVPRPQPLDLLHTALAAAGVADSKLAGRVAVACIASATQQPDLTWVKVDELWDEKMQKHGVDFHMAEVPCPDASLSQLAPAKLAKRSLKKIVERMMKRTSKYHSSHFFFEPVPPGPGGRVCHPMQGELVHKGVAVCCQSCFGCNLLTSLLCVAPLATCILLRD